MWNELGIELNIGQLLDITGSVQGDRRIELADRICRYKSGKYTVELPLHLGALLAGTSDVDEAGNPVIRVTARRCISDAR